MIKQKHPFVISLLVGFFATLTVGVFLYTQKSAYLTFSDAARFADAARQIVSGHGSTIKFAFYDPNFIINIKNTGTSQNVFQPFFALWISLFFKIFGVSDWSVLLSSAVPFVLTSVLLFLLGKTLKSSLAGVLAALTYASLPNFLEYASTGASEPLGIFLLVLTCLLALNHSKPASIIAGFIAVSLVFTRPQGILFTPMFFLLAFLNKQLLSFTLAWGLTLVMSWVIYGDFTFWHYLSGVLPLIGERLPGVRFNNSLIGQTPSSISITGLLSKTFYNLYNFSTKLFPQIVSPLLAVFSLTFLTNFKRTRSFPSVYLFFTGALFLAGAATLPHLRYLHFAIPIIILLGYIKLIEYTPKLLPHLVFLFLFLYPLFGLVVLDTRATNPDFSNFTKRPLHIVLSQALIQSTEPDSIILTNLDGWATWYANRHTMWIPATTSLLKDSPTLPDYIYMTDYKINDPDQALDSSWQSLFTDLPDKYISSNYQLVSNLEISQINTTLWKLKQKK